MSYNGSNSIGLLMPDATSYNYTGLNTSSLVIVEFGDTNEDNPEGEQTYHSCFGYSPDSSDLFFNGQDPYDNQNGCKMGHTELILFHNEHQLEDYNDDCRNLYYEISWDCFQSWFEVGEDEQELKPEHDCSSDALAVLEAILGY